MTKNIFRQRNWFRCLFFSLTLALFIISVAVTVTLLFTPLYTWEIQASGLDQLSGLTPAELMENYHTLISYNTLWGPRELQFPDFVMSKTGAIHFQEVRHIFLAFQIGIPVFGLLTAIGYWLAKLSTYSAAGAGSAGGAGGAGGAHSTDSAGGDFRFLAAGGFIAIALPLFLGVLCALAWDTVFVTFHHLFFRNDFWIFDERTDPIIRVLPDQFFLHEAVMIFCLVVLGGIVSIIAYRKLSIPQ